MRWLTGFVIAVSSVAMPVSGAAAPGGHNHGHGNGHGKPVVGARSLGDSLLPQLGNGGYDATHYTIELDYDPVANRFDAAKTTITAVASSKLREFSLDFQDDLDVIAVKVNGRKARFH